MSRGPRGVLEPSWCSQDSCSQGTRSSSSPSLYKPPTARRGASAAHVAAHRCPRCCGKPAAAAANSRNAPTQVPAVPAAGASSCPGFCWLLENPRGVLAARGELPPSAGAASRCRRCLAVPALPEARPGCAAQAHAPSGELGQVSGKELGSSRSYQGGMTRLKGRVSVVFSLRLGFF